MTPEGNLVAYLCKRAKAEGFRVRKLSYEGRHGAPDRLILAPGAAVFVEVKAPGQQPRPEQTRELAIFNDSGLQACWVASKEDIDSVLTELSLRLSRGFCPGATTRGNHEVHPSSLSEADRQPHPLPRADCRVGRHGYGQD